MHFHTVYIGVNYNTPDKAIEWVNSIHITNPDALIVLVDNSEVENTKLRDSIKEKATYECSGSNLGYFNGAAYGLHIVETQHTFEWVAVSNVDLILETKNVDSILDNYANAGVVAPSIVSFDTGFDKNPYRLDRPSKQTVMIKKIAFSNPLFSGVYCLLSDMRNMIIRKKHIQTRKCNEGEKIYLPYGAVLFFSKKYFEQGCVIDFPLFLFGEELFVAEQTVKVGIDIVYVPSIKFINYEHASTSLLTSKEINKRNYEAMKYVLKEYYSGK